MDIYKQDEISRERICKIQQLLSNWCISNYQPNYFLSLRLPKNRETENFNNARESLREILKKFEKELVGRNWNKHHLPFILFAENHRGDTTWHFHILFNSGEYDREKIMSAIYTTNNHLKLSRYCFFLEYIRDTITDVNNVCDYCVKEIEPQYYDRLDSDRFITSHDLFNIAVK